MNAIDLLRFGFINTSFVNHTPNAIKQIIMRVVNGPKVTLFPKRLNNIEVESINDISDKVSLTFDDEVVTSVWTWRKSEVGKRLVLSKIE
jgi:hypothetical protein